MFKLFTFISTSSPVPRARAVHRAEEERQAADLINHLAVANIATICHGLDCWLIHVSTDYVFDGNSEVPYKEDNLTNPQGIYGDSKLKGELAIEASGCKYIIIRTAWVYSEYGNNFLKTMLRLGADRDELAIVGDQVGCPTYAQDVAKTIVEILSELKVEGKLSGVYHYCGDFVCSAHGNDISCPIYRHVSVGSAVSGRLHAVCWTP